MWRAQAPPPVSPAQLARIARSRLVLPTPTITVNPAGTALTNLPVWLTLSSGWQQESATAAVPGVSVTATASPTKVVFDMGNGTSVTCTSPGTVYRPGVDDPRSASPDCGATYSAPSVGRPGEAYQITATVTFSVAWAGAGQAGVLEGLTSTGTTTLRVAESQAVITG